MTIKVRVAQEMLYTDGSSASVQASKDSVVTMEDNLARYVRGMDDGAYVTPVNIVQPSVDVSTVANGGTVTCSPGTWQGDPTITYSYQWYAGNTIMAGKTTAALATVAGDQGKTVKCRVTGTNSAGSSTADSAPCIVT